MDIKRILKKVSFFKITLIVAKGKTYTNNIFDSNHIFHIHKSLY